MKNKILILALLALGLPVCAANTFTSGDTTSSEYLINHGYSTNMAELIDLQKHQVNGLEYTNPIEPAEYNKQPIKAIRSFFKYIDPCLDDGKYMQHDTIESERFGEMN